MAPQPDRQRRANFTPVPNDLIDDPTLSDEVKMAWIKIARHSGAEQAPFPSIKRLAAMSGRLPRQEYTLQAALVKRGKLTKRRKPRSRSTEYDTEPAWTEQVQKIARGQHNGGLAHRSEGSGDDDTCKKMHTNKSLLSIGTTMRTVQEIAPVLDAAGWIDALGSGTSTADDVPEHLREHVLPFVIPF